MKFSARTLPGIILFAIGIILLLIYYLVPSSIGYVDLRQVLLLFPGVLFTMIGFVIAYIYKNH